MLFFFVEFLPIFEILIEVDLVSCPEGSEMFFVHFEDGMIVDGEEDETTLVGGEDGLGLLGRGEDRGGIHGNSN